MKMEFYIKNYYSFMSHKSFFLCKLSWFNSSMPWDEEQMNSKEWYMDFIQLCTKLQIAKLNDYLCFCRLHSLNMNDSSNKKNIHYFNEYFALRKTLIIAKKTNIQSFTFYTNNVNQFLCYFLPLFYIGSPLKGLSLLGKTMRGLSSILLTFGVKYITRQSK